MRVALMGAGSLGTVIGALAAKEDQEIILIDANQDHVKTLREKGATVTGKAKLNEKVTAITPDEMEGTYDIVLYLVKQTHNETALNSLLSHLHEESVVCTLQNGVPENEVAKYVGEERTLGGTVGWGATWVEPGVSELTSPLDKMTYDVGEINGEVTERAKKVTEILNYAGQAYLTTNLMGHRWAKLLINATLSGMSAILGCTFGEVLDDDKALTCVAHIGDEIIEVSKTLGIKLEPIQGNDLSVLSFETKEERQHKMELYKQIFGPHRALKASMLQDLEKGRRTEIGGLNGIVCEIGEDYNVPTPVNDQVTKLVKDIEGSKLKYEFSNLELFEIPEIN